MRYFSPVLDSSSSGNIPGSAQIVANKKPGLHPKRIPHKIPRSKKFEHWKRRK